jgi:hypothetical protein
VVVLQKQENGAYHGVVWEAVRLYDPEREMLLGERLKEIDHQHRHHT